MCDFKPMVTNSSVFGRNVSLRWIDSQNAGTAEKCDTVLLLPEGEGRDEGKVAIDRPLLNYTLPDLLI